MTRKEAIEILEAGRNPYHNIDMNIWCEAFEMSIEALKAINDIKAEIEERIKMWGTDGDEYHECLEIIDKHMKEGINEE